MGTHVMCIGEINNALNSKITKPHGQKHLGDNIAHGQKL